MTALGSVPVSPGHCSAFRIISDATSDAICAEYRYVERIFIVYVTVCSIALQKEVNFSFNVSIETLW